MMTDKYYPRGEIKKLEVEMWNLKVKGTNVVGYNQQFQELTLMCARMFPEESNKIEKYVRGHYKSDCPELKNQNHENQAEGTEARGMVYAFGGGETVQDPNTIEMRSKLKDKCCLACLVIPKVGNNLRLYLL
ncbi:hypothetical protein Tco_0634024 [Tanacetum coccineum]